MPAQPAFAPIQATPGSLPDLDLVRTQFARDGIVVIHDLYPADWIAAADAALAALLARADALDWAGTSVYCSRFETWTKMFGGLQEPPLRALFDADSMLDLTTAICGQPWVANQIGSWVTPPGCGQAWHQDSGIDDPAVFNLNRLVFTRDLLPGQGDLLIVPGSHRLGDLPAGELYEPLPGQIAITPRANTTVLLHTRTYHCVTRNASDVGRIQVNCRVTPPGVPPNICMRARFRTSTWDFGTSAPWTSATN